MRKTGIAFLAGEPLFLGGGDNPAVPDKRRRTVMVEGRNAKDQHASRPLKYGIDARPPSRIRVRVLPVKPCHDKVNGWPSE
jgi:hypothetical protein